MGMQASFGPIVDTRVALLPQKIRLAGRSVTLEPLDADSHCDALWDGAGGPERGELWAYLRTGPYDDRSAFAGDIQVQAASPDPFFYAIVDNGTGRAVGEFALMRIDAANRVIEVGHVLYTPALQKTPGATEAMYLLARYVFEDLGYRRFEWKCNALHQGSRNAALRFGFEFEAVFRQHMIVKGRNRDTAWFSMLDSEWSDRKRAFESWLDDANFDANGKQKRALGRKTS